MGTWHEQRKIQEPKFDWEAVNLGDQLSQLARGRDILQDMGLSELKPEKFLADWDDWSPTLSRTI